MPNPKDFENKDESAKEKRKIDAILAARRLLKGNPNHDSSGRFSSGDDSGGRGSSKPGGKPSSSSKPKPLTYGQRAQVESMIATILGDSAVGKDTHLAIEEWYSKLPPKERTIDNLASRIMGHVEENARNSDYDPEQDDERTALHDEWFNTGAEAGNIVDRFTEARDSGASEIRITQAELDTLDSFQQLHEDVEYWNEDGKEGSEIHIPSGIEHTAYNLAMHWDADAQEFDGIPVVITEDKKPPKPGKKNLARALVKAKALLIKD